MQSEEISVRTADASDSRIISEYIRKLAEFERMTGSLIAEENCIKEMMTESNGIRCLIAEYCGRPAGIALFNTYRLATFSGRRIMYLEDFIVDENLRGKGIGKAIFSALKELAAAEGCKRLEWKCLDWNTRAMEFYKSQGGSTGREWLTYTIELN